MTAHWMEKVLALYQSYGYLPYKMSRFEDYDLYVRNRDFLLSQRLITFPGEDGQLLALKPDITLSVVKNAPEAPGVVEKVYYQENVYRSPPGGGPIRELPQAGLECVGDLSSYEEAEVLLLAALTLSALPGESVLDLSHMGLISQVLDSCRVSSRHRPQVLAALERKSLHDLVGIPCHDKEKLELLISCSGSPEAVLPRLKAQLTAPGEAVALSQLERLCRMLTDSGATCRIRLDFSVSNQLKYYNGLVFKGYTQGVPTSILSGGQYDRLPENMGKRCRAMGFALYLDLLQEEQPPYDLDLLILPNPRQTPEEILKLTREASREGRVLVAPQPPKDRTWKRLLDFRKGEDSPC